MNDVEDQTTVRFLVVTFALLHSLAAAQAEKVCFDDQAIGAAPVGFTIAMTGSGSQATWIVRKAPGDQAGNVVMQTSVDGDSYRFPLLIYDKVSAVDLDLSVKFQAISGALDQSAGLVWRYQDANNYYIVRANALEDNVVLYKVEDGRRTDLPLRGQGRTYGAMAPVLKNDWNSLSVSVRGDVFTVSLNGNHLFAIEDRTFSGSGRVGLWTKADSVTMFDDLTITVVK